MKKLISALVICALVLSLSSCASILKLRNNTNAQEEGSASHATAETVSVSTVATEVPVESETTAATQPPTAPAEAPLYTVSLSGDTPIYDTPTYKGNFVQYVEITSVYTIMEEAYDESGNLWGRLKSGLGWVMLTRNSKYPYLVTMDGTCMVYEEPSVNSTYVGPVGARGVYTIMEDTTDAEGNLWGRLKSGMGWVMVIQANLVCKRCNVYFEYRGLYADGLCDECYYIVNPTPPETGNAENYKACSNCGVHTDLIDGLCEHCRNNECYLCGGPNGPDHNCDDYPNVLCPNPDCGWGMFTTGVGTDGIICPKCGTRCV